MKVLAVNATDVQGGAARAAYRLHSALIDQNIDSQMLVLSKSSDDYRVITEKNIIIKYLNKLRTPVDDIPMKFYPKKSDTLFSASWIGFSNIVDTINKLNPDIVHLHWICGGMLRIEDIARIKAPIIWSLHDNWPLTGGCHIMWECEKYKNECGACPRLGSKKDNDLSRKVFIRKQKTYNTIKNITIVALSRWLYKCSKKSTLLKDKPHVLIPNPIDTETFKPFDKKQSKALWKLPTNKKLVLFGASSATSDINKGFKQLCQALALLNMLDIEVVIFGSSRPENAPDFGFKTHYLGHLNDDVSLVTLYSSVDVMIVPSLQESFGQTASESMACGTPVVAFGHSGLLDIVDHKLNGFLAKPFQSDDLARGIEWVLTNENYEQLRVQARLKVVQNFDGLTVVKKYIDLYKKVLIDKSKQLEEI